jgi:hypothetical protein
MALPPAERYEFANLVLDSIDDSTNAEIESELLAELNARRSEMLRGENIVEDWRAALDQISASLGLESR